MSGNKSLAVEVTRTSSASDGKSPPYTYSFGKVGGKGSVDSSSGLIDFSGEGKNKYAVSFSIGSPFASVNESVSFADPPVTVSVPQGLFSSIAGSGGTTASMEDDDSKDEVQGYEYSLFFDDGTSLDPRILNR